MWTVRLLSARDGNKSSSRWRRKGRRQGVNTREVRVRVPNEWNVSKEREEGCTEDVVFVVEASNARQSKQSKQSKSRKEQVWQRLRVARLARFCAGGGDLALGVRVRKGPG